MGKLVYQYASSNQAKGFATWKVFVIWQQQDETEKARQNAVVERCVRRMQQMSHARVFGRWYEAVQEVKAMRHKMGIVLGRWNRRGLCGALESWVRKYLLYKSDYTSYKYLYTFIAIYTHLCTPVIHVYAPYIHHIYLTRL